MISRVASKIDFKNDKHDNCLILVLFTVCLSFPLNANEFALPERLHKVQIRELVQLHERVQHLDVEIIPVDRRN